MNLDIVVSGVGDIIFGAMQTLQISSSPRIPMPMALHHALCAAPRFPHKTMMFFRTSTDASSVAWYIFSLVLNLITNIAHIKTAGVLHQNNKHQVEHNCGLVITTLHSLITCVLAGSRQIARELDITNQICVRRSTPLLSRPLFIVCTSLCQLTDPNCLCGMQLKSQTSHMPCWIEKKSKKKEKEKLEEQKEATRTQVHGVCMWVAGRLTNTYDMKSY